PLVALVMRMMMGMIFGIGLTGLLMEEFDALWGADWTLQAHEILANTLCALVLLHMAAAIFESYKLRDNLPLSILTGKRR
ncbi:cytochrome b/b6 domain-containing protein, partial [Pseudomonas syringae group genomosp. 7]|uniref:cytochrome b/b6 domain-containing protein n=1 Tax=Pseudomonas syringae group genomosp. 7 TaxID=251699 RepID=UPI00376FF3A2